MFPTQMQTKRNINFLWASLVTQKNPLAVQEMQVRFLGQEDPLEKGMATHSRILAWEIPWTEEPDRLQSTGSQRVRHNLATKQQHNFLQQCCLIFIPLSWVEFSHLKTQVCGWKRCSFC